MFVHVYNPQSGHTYLLRRMGRKEVMNARKFADDIAVEHDTVIDDSGGHIPSCSGDLRVEFRQFKRETGVI